MGLVGRLDDLSVADIIQIVHLSRRTGRLEIVDGNGTYTLLFCRGLLVNGTSTADPDFIRFLSSHDVVAPNVLRSTDVETSGAVGDVLLDMKAVTADALAGAVRDRILAIVQPLTQSQDGEFTFHLQDSMSAADIGFEPKRVFKEGGLTPQKIFGTSDKEKLKPLRGLEQTLKVGKALLGAAAVPALPIAQPVESAAPQNVVQFPFHGTPTPSTERARETEPFAAKGTVIDAQAHVSVVIFERNPLIRVALKRAFTREHLLVEQFGSIDDARRAITEMFACNKFFVTVLEQTPDGESLNLLQYIKRRSSQFPVFVVGTEPSIEYGGERQSPPDAYRMKPLLDVADPSLVARQLASFADDLVLLAQYAFGEWERTTACDPDAVRRLYEKSDAENRERRSSVLRNLISGLADPNDIGLVATTVLRLLQEYVDRGALFIVAEREFIGVGGFGGTGTGEDINGHAAASRIARDAPSVLQDVASSRAPHRGKLRRTEANVKLIQSLGRIVPTEVLALPIVHGGNTIAVLYGDNAEQRAPIESVSGVEVFLAHAADAFATALFGAEMVGASRW